jgi:magnesium chelatase subunit D
MNHRMERKVLPFMAIVGQEKMKKALILNAINSRIGGVLIRGEKGTAKSTAVRALAELLPQIEVVKGCVFNCDPQNQSQMCQRCLERINKGQTLETEKRPMHVIDLPLGATEDRVIGTIDIERAIKEGIQAFEPGILADANRGILYIDEVNLLDDHVADVILDAAAMGINIVEREGISVRHMAKFILIGTMNPEEGELRPQLLDRFGLQVDVESLDEPELRVEIVKVVERFENDPEGLKEKFQAKQDDLRKRIENAKSILKDVQVSDEILKIIADVCIELGVKSHRAEIVITRTARTIAAFDGRKFVNMDDIKEAMELALPHRMRRKPFEPPTLNQEKLEQTLNDVQKKQAEKNQSEKKPQPKDEEQQRQNLNPLHQNNQEDRKEEGAKEFIFDIGDSIDVQEISKSLKKKDKIYRRKISGRRVSTKTSSKNGRSLRSQLPQGNTKDIALDATIRAAASKQLSRKEENKAIVIKQEDIRQHQRRGKVSIAIVFVVDASGSMGAQNRMKATKGAVLSLLLDSYQKRDKIGLIGFRGNKAELLLPLCSSVDLAQKSLQELPTGGRTPLASGLVKAIELLLAERKKNKEVIPVLVLISDGRANVSLGEGSKSIFEELVDVCEQVRSQGIHTVVIDVESTHKTLQLNLGYCKEVARITGGIYHQLENLTAKTIYDVVSKERRKILGLLEKRRHDEEN